MSDSSVPPEARLIGWLLDLLERGEDPWSDSQQSFLAALLRSPEGSRTLGKLAATTMRLRKTGMSASQMGHLAEIHGALEAFWKDPSPETYKELGIARW